MHMNRFFVSSLLVLSLLLGAAPAHAALTNEQIDAVLSLLRSFGTESSVVIDVERALRAPQGCPLFTISMARGSGDETTGGQVSVLQRHLGVAPVSGYYGPLTESAVQQFQSENGVVSSGARETTGYGVVGPKTRAKIFEVCEAEKTTQGVTQTEKATPSVTEQTVPAIPQTTTSSINPLSQEFLDSVYEVGVAKGLSQSELTQVREVLDGLEEETTIPTTEESSQEDSSDGFNVSELIGPLIEAAASAELGNTTPTGPSCGTPGLDFGTPKVIHIIECGCSRNRLVVMQPVAPDNVNRLVYYPGTQQCENFNIPKVGQALVGKYRKPGWCWIPAGKKCKYIQSDGTILPGTGSSLQ